MLNEQYYEQLIADLRDDMPETAQDMQDLLNAYRDMVERASGILLAQLNAERAAQGC